MLIGHVLIAALVTTAMLIVVKATIAMLFGHMRIAA